MYPTYVVRSTPCASRNALRRAPSHARSLSTGPGNIFPATLFGARHHPFFNPPSTRARTDVFDHFDDFVNRSFEGLFPHANARADTPKAWQPRFDVREVDDAYHLRGELPGVDSQNLEVEFSDANTLVMRGRTESERAEGTQPAQQSHDAEVVAEKSATAQEAQNDDAASVHSESSYVKPSVEDEADATRRESVGTPTESTDAAAAPNTDDAATQQEAKTPQGRYWVSERSTGSFSRTFEFPGRVDADGVTASLKNGILDVVVPKAKAPEARKIQVA